MDSRLLVVTGRAGGLMPGGICLDDAAFPAVRDALRRRRAHGRPVATDELASPGLMPTDLRLRPAHVSPDAIADLAVHAGRAGHRPAADTGAGLDPAPIRARAGELVRAAVGHGASQVGTVLGALVGAGPGTTPTGDDVVVGVLAGLRVTDRGRAATAISSALPNLLPRTTLASRHYLTAAAQGRFGEHVHELVAAVIGRAAADHAVDRARAWGSTSGLDLLSGLLAATRPSHDEHMEALA